MNSINKRVLVLNLDYRPLNICNVRRAFVLLLNGKAEVIEQYADNLISAEAHFHVPIGDQVALLGEASSHGSAPGTPKRSFAVTVTCASTAGYRPGN